MDAKQIPNLEYTPLEEIDKIHRDLRRGFNSGKFKRIAYRKVQILQLGYLLKDNIDRFKEALAIDLGRPVLESVFLEIAGAITDCKYAYDHVDKWAKNERAPFSFQFAVMRPTVRKEPKGVVLIISPFNYPVTLLVGPLVGAIAAGNAVVLKPSELSSATAALMAELIPKYMDQDLVRVVNGGVPETTKVLSLPWDHILYTGGGRVARIVCEAAARHLTPVSLELGGKSPAVIDPNCDLKTTARRLLWGKFVNAGQTCIAPDFVLVPKHFQDKLVAALQEVHASFYSSDPASNISRIVSSSHFTRIKRLLDDTDGKIVIGGEMDEKSKYVAPTVVKDVKEDDSLMSEELFAPILPIVPVDNVDEAIAYINRNNHPLVLYVFSRDAKFKSKVFDNTQSGAVVANETLIHMAAPGLPFGGIGPSGSGYHTGKFSFDMFTHLRASLDNPSWVDLLLGTRFPPYTKKKVRRIEQVMIPRLPARPLVVSGAPLRVKKSSLSNPARHWGAKFLFVLGLFAASSVVSSGGVVVPPWVYAWMYFLGM